MAAKGERWSVREAYLHPPPITTFYLIVFFMFFLLNKQQALKATFIRHTEAKVSRLGPAPLIEGGGKLKRTACCIYMALSLSPYPASALLIRNRRIRVARVAFIFC